MVKEERIKFRKGMQRKFLDLVVIRLNCVSVRGILQFGFDMPYSSLKNYYIERRLMSRSFFLSLCHIAHVSKDEVSFRLVNGNWGQVKGGKLRGR